MSRFFVLATVILVGALAASAATTHAQYPTVVGSATLSTPNPNPPVGSTTTLVCQVQGTSGASQAGVTCTFTIVSEPGDDAAVGSKVITKTTDASGRATTELYTGTTAGVIVVKVDAGQVSSSLVVNVGTAPAPPPAAPVSQSLGTTSVSISPPSTGDGGLLD